MAIKLNYKEVLDYFDGLSNDMAELVIEMVKEKLDAKEARRAKISANLKKARAAKGTAKPAEAAAPVEPAHRRPGRPARVEQSTQSVHDTNQALTAGQ